MAKYMLISVIEREILTETFDTLQEAKTAMVIEMVQEAGVDDAIFGKDIYDDGYCGFGDDGGYVTDGKNHCNYDWRIVELNEQDLDRVQNTYPYPTITLPLPDGTSLRAEAIDDENFPAINVYWDRGSEKDDIEIAFVEYNPEHEKGQEVSIGVYSSSKPEPVYYESYRVGGANVLETK